MKTKNFTLTAIFVAIILLFALTPFGFIHLGVIKATLIHIPIIIASIILGPKIGAFLGLVFGLTSIATNTMSPTLLSFAFSPAIPVLGTSHGSLWALFIAIVPRMILGMVPYFIFKALQRFMLRKKSNAKPAFFVTGLLATFIHTFLVMGSISFIFHDAYAQAINADSLSAVYKAVLTIFLTNGLAEAILAAIASMAVTPALLKVGKR